MMVVVVFDAFIRSISTVPFRASNHVAFLRGLIPTTVECRTELEYKSAEIDSVQRQ